MALSEQGLEVDETVLIGSPGVEVLEEGRDPARVRVRGEEALQVRGGALDRLAVDRRRAGRPGAVAAGDLADRPHGAVGELLRGAGHEQRRDDHRDQQQHPDVLGGDLPALPSQHARKRRARCGEAREPRGST
jgi:hypothetical protein